MLLLTGSSNHPLAQQIATQLSLTKVPIDISRFANGEKRIRITQEVRGENVVLVQSFSHPVDEHIMETMLIIDALERMGARHVNLIIPWMGYSFQDKVFRSGEPIAAKVVATVLSHAYIKRIFLLDLHNSSIPGFFSVPSHHLSAHELFAQYVRESIGLQNTVIASPDFGGLKRARTFADMLSLDLINIDKHRDLSTGAVTALGITGEVQDKTVVLIDDAILTGSTAIETARLLKSEGARQVIFMATHAVFGAEVVPKLATSSIDRIVITNSITHAELPEQFVQLDTAGIFVQELQTWA